MVMTYIIWATLFVGLFISVFWLIMFVENLQRFRDESNLIRKPKRNAFVSVIIPAYNAQDTVVSCLQSVLALDYPKDKLDITIVDDGSTDATYATLQDYLAKNPSKNVRILQQSNSGKARALNHALQTIKGEYFACLDADSYIDPGSLTKMLYLFDKYGKELAIVTPAMKIYKPKSILQRLQNFEYLVAILINRINSRLDSIYVAPGPFSVYQTNLIRRHGGFDEENLTEDMEVAYRMQKNHYKIAQCYDAYVHTDGPKSLKQLYKQRLRWYKGGFLNLIKYRSMLFNRDYGHFGMYQIPLTLVSFVMSFLVVFFFAYFALFPVATNLYNFYLINFDLAPYLNNLVLNFDLLSFNFLQLFILFGSFSVGLFLFVASHSNAKEKIRLSTLTYMPPYFIFYYIIIGFFCVAAILDVFLGSKKQKW